MEILGTILILFTLAFGLNKIKKFEKEQAERCEELKQNGRKDETKKINLEKEENKDEIIKLQKQLITKLDEELKLSKELISDLENRLQNLKTIKKE